MNIETIEKAKTLPAAEAEKLAAGSGGEFHPLVCDAVTPGGCKHVSQSQRIERVAAYEKAKAKAGAVAFVVEAAAAESVTITETPAAVPAEVPPELSIAAPPEPEVKTPAAKPAPRAKHK